MADEGKKTRGRQRIEIKKIEKEEDLLVSFSKRRSGIYKKASDMLTLCGGEVAIVIYSPTGKPFSFGQPSVDHVINRYLDRISPEDNDYTHQLMEAHRKMRIEELVERHNERSNALEDALERRKALQAKARRRKSSEGFWWNVALDGLNVEELKEVYAQMEEMHMTASGQLKERSDQTADAMFDDANNNPNGVAAAFDSHGYDFGCGY